MPTQKLKPEIIHAAIAGFEAQKKGIDAQIAELREMVNPVPAIEAAESQVPARKGRRFSAVARRRMKQAQQRRWAKVRGESEPRVSATPEPAEPKRRISEEGMKRIIAASKKRWRLQKAEAAKAQPTAKKAAPGRKKAPRVKAA